MVKIQNSNFQKVRASIEKHMKPRIELRGSLWTHDAIEVIFARTRYRHSDAEKLKIASSVASELDGILLSYKWETQRHWAHGTFDAFVATIKL